MVKVLIVDDEQPCCDSLRLLLTLENFEAVSASNAEDALRLAAAHRPDVVVVDLVLRERRTGLDVLDLLRQNYPALPAIVITGYPSAELEERVRNMPQVDFLAKPYQPAELLAALRREGDADDDGRPRSDRPQ